MTLNFSSSTTTSQCHSSSSPQLQVLLHVQLVGHEQLDKVDDAAKVVLLVGGEGVDPIDQLGESDERALRAESQERLAKRLELLVVARRPRRLSIVLFLPGNSHRQIV